MPKNCLESNEERKKEMYVKNKWKFWIEIDANWLIVKNEMIRSLFWFSCHALAIDDLTHYLNTHFETNFDVNTFFVYRHKCHHH